ncbi:type II toxin-antitoxin system death-on-curing family toxin [Bacillus sp. REN16]|uniref:type II toxin-antitoxin system death-on-curing family toxin n=1 Tax=Bacillus sp. REN16 TaxID=2887296 RepID=UPI001E5B034F|nr:type II toxin-antitoxin system death-on-curing family toxin [Bacillus sp. REN16]MCC3359590.1 type II toxin-antitoxin system death-on-curing family toxin [Bacillus sp. REN16]
MRYLTEQEVIAVNYLLIDRYSPNEPKGLKDMNLLNSSIERPKQTVFGEDAYVAIFEKGAALFESIAKNHCFLNANKRTAFVCLVQFLSYNGYRFAMDPKEAEDFVVDAVTHQYEFNDIVKIIKEHSILK